MHRKNKRARKSASNGSTSTIMAALNGSDHGVNHDVAVDSSNNESIAREINQITALEAELHALNQGDMKLVASLMAVLEEETAKLNQEAARRNTHIQEMAAENDVLQSFLSEKRHV